VDDLLRRSAIELATMIRSREISSRELVDASLRRIDELQPQINAFTHVAHESALAAAAEIDAEVAAQIDGAGVRPFAGVPIAVKDNRPVAGMPITMCSDLFGDIVAGHDAYLVRRLRDAGFVIVGKTTLPEMGILPTTESRRFGPTRNPWDLERTPGGSSGGSAAAVAAEMVPIAHGNDGGGSLRIPAACCGLVGLKPSRGRVSVGPDAGDSLLVQDGVLTRTVAETAALLDLLAGYELGDATWAPARAEPFAELAARPASFAALATRDPGRLRIGLALTPPLEGATVDPVCERAARDAAELLESLGHTVEEITPPWCNREVLPDFTRLFGPMVSLTTMIGGKIRGREPTADDVEPLTWALWERARATDAVAFLSAEGRIKALARKVVKSLDAYDAVLTPALATPPVPIGEIHGRGPDPWDHYRRSGYFTPFTAILNVTGLPAVSLPLYETEDGLPLAVQLAGRPLGEGTLLSLATQLEAALPWAERRPPLAAAV
jgi:amidase